MITSLHHYIEKVQNQEQQQVSLWLYRGHCDSMFKLVPGLFRINRDTAYASWDRVESYIIKQFKRESVPFLKSIPQDHEEWLVMAQHYGLPTRLLDWTSNPLIALYFACENFTNEKDADVCGCTVSHR